MHALPHRVPALSLVLASVTLTAAVSPSHASETTPAFPPHALDGTELRVLPPTAAERHYQLHIGLPKSYRSDPTKRYPVVYATDGYWSFAPLHGIYWNLVYDQVVPEFILVGLGYAGENLDYEELRGWELFPATFDEHPKESGHAGEFLQSLEREIIPFVEREYRADPSCRVLIGHSMGGLFTLYAMFTKPELFQGYLAGSPDVFWLHDYEEAFAHSGRPIPARLYLTAAGDEIPSYRDEIIRFHDRLVTRNYGQLSCEFRRIDGVRHCGAVYESYVRGLQFIFHQLAPESGVEADEPLYGEAWQFHIDSVAPHESPGNAVKREIVSGRRVPLSP